MGGEGQGRREETEGKVTATDGARNGNRRKRVKLLNIHCCDNFKDLLTMALIVCLHILRLNISWFTLLNEGKKSLALINF